jgi:cytochrome c553
MYYYYRVLKAVLVAIPCLVSSVAFAQTDAVKAAAALRQSSCRSCHGETGDSSSNETPRLNGQPFEYLRGRLESFRYPIREAPRTIHIMGHLSPTLTDQASTALAQFYATQAPSPPGGDANKVGAAIYRNGAKDIPACHTCHGEWGEGRGAVPRLVGQHRAYLRLQLQVFSMAARIADPMNHHVWAMKPEQADAMAAYLAN